MKLVVGEQSYDMYDAVGSASLGDLMALVRFNGATVRSMKGMWGRMSDLALKDDFDQLDFLADPDMLRDFVGLIFLVKRAAGEALTPADAAAVSWSDFSLSMDDDEPEDDAPKGPAAE